jgi:FkbM family methyltransferase
MLGNISQLIATGSTLKDKSALLQIGFTNLFRAFYVKWRMRLANNIPEFQSVPINGYQVLVRPKEHMGASLRYLGEKSDYEEFRTIRRFIKRSDLCFDIGANIGYYTLMLAKVAKEVHAFEPVPLSCHLLHSNVVINGITNVIVNPYAVGNLTGETLFNIAADSAYCGFYDTKIVRRANSMRVSAIRLDDYCASRKISRVDFLKVDVEGAESLVLDGARETLKAGPRFMMIELADCVQEKYHSSVDDIVKAVASYGYKPFIPINGNLCAFRSEHYNLFSNVFFFSSDFLPNFTRPSSVDQ